MLGTCLALPTVTTIDAGSGTLPDKSPSIRLAIAVLLGIGLSAILLVAMLAGVDSQPVALVMYSYVVAGAAGAMVGILVWLFAGTVLESHAAASLRSCRACGAQVLHDWRLCPECGRLLEARSVPCARSTEDARPISAE